MRACPTAPSRSDLDVRAVFQVAELHARLSTCPRTVPTKEDIAWTGASVFEALKTPPCAGDVVHLRGDDDQTPYVVQPLPESCRSDWGVHPLRAYQLRKQSDPPSSIIVRSRGDIIVRFPVPLVVRCPVSFADAAPELTISVNIKLPCCW